MAKYHLNPTTGEPGFCRAQKKCPYGDLEADHYPSVAAARAGYEAAMRDWVAPAETCSPTLTLEEVEAMEPEAQRRTLGAIWRVLSKVMRDSQAADYWQAVYDSTPAGALWLERKRKDRGGGERENPEYLQRSAALERHRESFDRLPVVFPEDPGHVFNREFSSHDPLAYPDDAAMRDEKTKLALLSAAWMRSLTPEEIEAVSWVTSNGASVLNTHISGEEHTIWGHEVYSKKQIEESLTHFRSAMAKAPELDEPVIIYRGTSLDRAQWEHLDRPASATISGDRAKGFRGTNDDGTWGEQEAVILEIKTKKVASVCGMGVWGLTEMEVLAPLGRYHRVDDFVTLRGRERETGVRSGDIDPEFDRIRVIQLEHLGD